MSLGYPSLSDHCLLHRGVRNKFLQEEGGVHECSLDRLGTFRDNAFRDQFGICDERRKHRLSVVLLDITLWYYGMHEQLELREAWAGARECER